MPPSLYTKIVRAVEKEPEFIRTKNTSRHKDFTTQLHIVAARRRLATMRTVVEQREKACDVRPAVNDEVNVKLAISTGFHSLEKRYA